MISTLHRKPAMTANTSPQVPNWSDSLDWPDRADGAGRHNSLDSPDENARQALRLAAAALDAAKQQAQPYAMSTALAQLACAHATLQAWPMAEGCLQQALRWSRAAQSTDLTVDLLCELCELAVRVAEQQDAQHAGGDSAQEGAPERARDRARDHAFEACGLAHRVTDSDWEIKVLLRLSDVLDRCGDRDDAVQLQARALRLMVCGPATEWDATVMPGLGRLADA